MSKFVRFSALLLAALFAAVLAIPAFADLIIEPQNPFYDKHEDDCRHVEARRYVVKEGGMNVCAEPGGDAKYRMDEGAQFSSQWQYTDSELNIWGYIEDYSYPAYSDESKAGWFKLEDTMRLYDHIDFDEEHGKEFYPDPGERDLPDAAAYEYPNGPLKFEEPLTDLTGMVFSRLYKDENGREWGFTGYRYGMRNFWICIDDPANKELTAGETPLFDSVTGEASGNMKADEAQPEKGGDSGERVPFDPNEKPVSIKSTEKDGSDGGKPWLIICAVAAAVCVSAAALALLFKKKKQ